MKVGIITLHCVKNYGSVLQTFATQKLFEDLGLNVEIIDFVREDQKDENILDTWTRNDSGIKKNIKKLILLPTVYKWKRVFKRFLKDNIHLSANMYSTEEELIETPPKADIYCTGSDQVWNTQWNGGIIKSYYLNFVPNGKKMISYSSSFGLDKLHESDKPIIKNLLDAYSSISVREESGMDILSNLNVSNFHHILDPTMAFNKEFWDNICLSEKLIPEKYVLVYQLNSNKRFDEYAKKLANAKGYRLVRLCTRYDQFIKVGKSVIIPEVFDFVRLIRDAELVITDSFHATGFSINLNKRFISIYPEKFSSRIDSILELVNLKDQKLRDWDDFSIADNSIDFRTVNEILDAERKKSSQFIIEALNLEDNI